MPHNSLTMEDCAVHTPCAGEMPASAAHWDATSGCDRGIAVGAWDTSAEGDYFSDACGHVEGSTGALGDVSHVVVCTEQAESAYPWDVSPTNAKVSTGLGTEWTADDGHNSSAGAVHTGCSCEISHAVASPGDHEGSEGYEEVWNNAWDGRDDCAEADAGVETGYYGDATYAWDGYQGACGRASDKDDGDVWGHPEAGSDTWDGHNPGEEAVVVEEAEVSADCHVCGGSGEGVCAGYGCENGCDAARDESAGYAGVGYYEWDACNTCEQADAEQSTAVAAAYDASGIPGYGHAWYGDETGGYERASEGDHGDALAHEEADGSTWDACGAHAEAHAEPSTKVTAQADAGGLRGGAPAAYGLESVPGEVWGGDTGRAGGCNEVGNDAWYECDAWEVGGAEQSTAVAAAYDASGIPGYGHAWYGDETGGYERASEGDHGDTLTHEEADGSTWDACGAHAECDAWEDGDAEPGTEAGEWCREGDSGGAYAGGGHEWRGSGVQRSARTGWGHSGAGPEDWTWSGQADAQPYAEVTAEYDALGFGEGGGGGQGQSTGDGWPAEDGAGVAWCLGYTSGTVPALSDPKSSAAGAPAQDIDIIEHDHRTEGCDEVGNDAWYECDTWEVGGAEQSTAVAAAYDASGIPGYGHAWYGDETGGYERASEGDHGDTLAHEPYASAYGSAVVAVGQARMTPGHEVGAEDCCGAVRVERIVERRFVPADVGGGVPMPLPRAQQCDSDCGRGYVRGGSRTPRRSGADTYG